MCYYNATGCCESQSEVSRNLKEGMKFLLNMKPVYSIIFSEQKETIREIINNTNYRN